LLAVPILAVAKSAIGSLLRDPELEPSRVNALRPANARPLPDQSLPPAEPERPSP
jgi:hypothetical protein